MSLIQLISLQLLSQTNQKFLENLLISRIALIWTISTVLIVKTNPKWTISIISRKKRTTIITKNSVLIGKIMIFSAAKIHESHLKKFLSRNKRIRALLKETSLKWIKMTTMIQKTLQRKIQILSVGSKVNTVKNNPLNNLNSKSIINPRPRNNSKFNLRKKKV